MKLSQDVVNNLASKHQLAPSHIEHSSDGTMRFYLERDIPDTELYLMSVVKVPPKGQPPITAFCGLYNSKRKMVADGDKPYETLEAAFEDIASRFGALEALQASRTAEAN